MPIATNYTRETSAFTGLTQAAVSEASLKVEINADAGIGPACSNVSISGPTVTISFKDALGNPLETDVLDALVVAHTGVSITEEATLISMESNPLTGLPVFQNHDIPPGAADLSQSWQVVAPAKTIVNMDVLISDELGLVGPAGICHLAGGKYRSRTNAANGSSLHMAIVDRDNVSGIFSLLSMVRTKLLLSSLTGVVNIGDYAVGGTTGARSEVLAVLDSQNIEITFNSGWENGMPTPWVDGEAVTFEDSAGTPTGASAPSVDWQEGGIYEIDRPVKEEFIEGFEEDEIAPGGSKPIPSGYYVRLIGYNNHDQDLLRVKIRLKMGRE